MFGHKAKINLASYMIVKTHELTFFENEFHVFLLFFRGFFSYLITLENLKYPSLIFYLYQ